MIKNVRSCIKLFDKQFYLSQYPEVEKYRLGALAHALRYGIRENRSISPWLNTGWYSERYPESTLSGLSATEHYLRHGWKDGNYPCPEFDTVAYLSTYPDVAQSNMNPLIHFVKFGLAEGRITQKPRRNEQFAERRTVASAGQTVENLIRTRWLSNEPIRLMHDSGESPRVLLVTDSFSPDSLFGGVATSVIFAALLAKELDYGLCLVTRHNPNVDLGVVSSLLEHYGIHFLGRMDHEHLFPDSSKVLATNDRDIFVGTSWWSTAALLSSVIDPKRIVYILQEDEREFYPSGDERLRASQVINDKNISVIINTSNLKNYLIKTGLTSLKDTSLDFEPAFNVHVKKPKQLKKYAKKRLFFYARPNNHRNLFFLGIEAIDKALLNGTIDSDFWDIVLVGKDLPEITFSNGTSPLVAGNLSHKSYSDFLKSFDAGFSLMATPHPSYPPFDLAASGIPVLTNSWAGKPDLTKFSPLILMAKPEIEELVKALSVLVNSNFQVSPNKRLSGPYKNSWEENLDQVVKNIVVKLGL